MRNGIHTGNTMANPFQLFPGMMPEPGTVAPAPQKVRQSGQIELAFETIFAQVAAINSSPSPDDPVGGQTFSNVFHAIAPDVAVTDVPADQSSPLMNAATPAARILGSSNAPTEDRAVAPLHSPRLQSLHLQSSELQSSSHLEAATSAEPTLTVDSEAITVPTKKATHQPTEDVRSETSVDAESTNVHATDASVSTKETFEINRTDLVASLDANTATTDTATTDPPAKGADDPLGRSEIWVDPTLGSAPQRFADGQQQPSSPISRPAPSEPSRFADHNRADAGTVSPDPRKLADPQKPAEGDRDWSQSSVVNPIDWRSAHLAGQQGVTTSSSDTLVSSSGQLTKLGTISGTSFRFRTEVEALKSPSTLAGVSSDRSDIATTSSELRSVSRDPGIPIFDSDQQAPIDTGSVLAGKSNQSVEDSNLVDGRQADVQAGPHSQVAMSVEDTTVGSVDSSIGGNSQNTTATANGVESVLREQVSADRPNLERWLPQRHGVSEPNLRPVDSSSGVWLAESSSQATTTAPLEVDDQPTFRTLAAEPHTQPGSSASTEVFVSRMPANDSTAVEPKSSEPIIAKPSEISTDAAGRETGNADPVEQSTGHPSNTTTSTTRLDIRRHSTSDSASGNAAHFDSVTVNRDTGRLNAGAFEGAIPNTGSSEFTRAGLGNEGTARSEADSLQSPDSIQSDRSGTDDSLMTENRVPFANDADTENRWHTGETTNPDGSRRAVFDRVIRTSDDAIPSEVSQPEPAIDDTSTSMPEVSDTADDAVVQAETGFETEWVVEPARRDVRRESNIQVDAADDARSTALDWAAAGVSAGNSDGSEGSEQHEASPQYAMKPEIVENREAASSVVNAWAASQELAAMQNDGGDPLSLEPLLVNGPTEDVTREIGGTLKQAAESSLQQEGGEVQLRLHPAELGELRIRVVQVDGGVETQIIASEHMTSELLHQHRDQLVSALSGLGFESSDVDISYSSHSDRSSQDSAHSRSGNEEPSRSFKPKVPTTAASQSQTSGGLNIVA